MKFNINLIFNAIALAMGIVVIVLNILHAADTSTSILLLSIGLACLAITKFHSKKNRSPQRCKRRQYKRFI